MPPPPQPRLLLPSSIDPVSQTQTQIVPAGESTLQAKQPDNQNEPLTPSPSSPSAKGKLFSEKHEQENQIFIKTFDKHMENKPVKHDNVFAFLFSWAPALDDLKVAEEVRHDFEISRK